MNRPLVAEELHRPQFKRDLQLPPGNSFVRLLVAQVIAQVTRTPLAHVIERHWPSDQIVMRAASAPAMTSVTGWAAELARKVVADAIEALGPASAGAQLLKQSLVLSFDGAGSISVPGFGVDPGTRTGAFVAEGQPIPVGQLNVAPTQLDPHKLAAIAVLTREMVESSNVEALIGDALIVAAGRVLDEVLFDANPGDAARPPGLRYGISATTPSNNADASEAVLEDFAALINELAPVAGNGPYVFVAAPGRAALMAARVPNQIKNLIVLGSSAVVNDVLAIAPAALVAAFSPNPETETSKAATLVMEDTAPGAAGTMGPERSVWQTDSIALKMRWPVSWALRDPRGFAWMTPAWKAPTPP